MSYTEVTQEGWFSRLGGAFKGIVFGILLVLVSLPLLFWNEGRAVHQAQALEEGRGAVTTVSAEQVDPAKEGRLVHLSGAATPEGPLEDAEFAVQVPNVLRLRRLVEMYQWREDAKKETRKKMGGGEETVTTYTYQMVWSDEPIDSKKFKEPHQNPAQLPYQPVEKTADPVRLGAFTLGPELVSLLSGWTDQRVDSKLPESLSATWKPLDGGFYRGENPASPKQGDVRIRYQVVPAGDVSLVGVQAGATFRPFQAQSGNEILEVVSGKKTADEMFQQMEQANTVTTWGLRALGFFLMFVGISLVLRPLSVLADVVPFFGNLVGCGSGLVAFGLAAPLSMVVLSIGWIAYRPLVGVPLLLLGVVGLVAGIAFLRRKRG